MNLSKRELELDKVGSTYIKDSVFLFVIPPAGLLSLAGNLLSYSIFSARYFEKKPLYYYLKVVCLNSSLINLIFVISFICDSRRFLELANTEFATYFRCYVKILVICTCYFYGCLLDIVLAIDRMVEFTKYKGLLRQMNPKKVCISIALVCIAINAPYVLIFEPKKKLLVYGNTTEEFFYYGESRFALTFQGRVFKNILYFIRDVLTIFVLVLVNFITLYLFRREYRLERLARSVLSREGSLEAQSKSLVISCDSSRTYDCANLQELKFPPFPPRRSSVEVLRRKMSKTNLFMTVAQVNTMLTKMVFIICVFSFLEHLFFTMGLHMFTDFPSSIKLDIYFCTNLSMFLKNSINIFIFYNFNAFFKKRFDVIFSKEDDN